MSQFSGAVAVLSALSAVHDGSLSRLRDRLPIDVRPMGPTIELFTMERGHKDAGAAVHVTATRGDGRYVGWSVTAWIYPTAQNDWCVNVKAEIDLDDSEGLDRCVLNEQQIVTDPDDTVRAIRHAAELVVGFPREDLLTSGWEPHHWRADDALGEGEPHT